MPEQATQNCPSNDLEIVEKHPTRLAVLVGDRGQPRSVLSPHPRGPVETLAGNAVAAGTSSHDRRYRCAGPSSSHSRYSTVFAPNVATATESVTTATVARVARHSGLQRSRCVSISDSVRVDAVAPERCAHADLANDVAAGVVLDE